MKRYPAHVLHTGARFQRAAQVSGGVRGSQAASDRELEYLSDALLCSTADVESATRLNFSYHFQDIRRSDLVHRFAPKKWKHVPL